MGERPNINTGYSCHKGKIEANLHQKPKTKYIDAKKQVAANGKNYIFLYMNGLGDFINFMK
jgi:hypothetical protein